jgi:XapX domain-containing protein
MFGTSLTEQTNSYIGRSKTMGKIITGLFLGFLIGIGCRFFDIPLPSPPKLIGALVVLSMTFGYVGMDYLLARHAKKTASIARSLTTAQYCGGPTGLPPSREQK